MAVRGPGLSTFSSTISSCKLDDEFERRRLALPEVSGDSLRIRLAIGFGVGVGPSDAVRRVLDSAICGSKEGGVTGRPRSSKRRSEGVSSRIWGREVVD